MEPPKSPASGRLQSSEFPLADQDSQIIGITGGIATGKSTVADYLQTTQSVPILDADQLARDAVVPGSPILASLFAHFGSQICQADGSLNRAALAELIFSNPQERAWLEAQIHPYVRQCLIEQAEKLAQEPIIVMVIPLLFEAQMTDLVDQIWVVTCSPDQQLQRLQQRNHLSLAQAQARIASQMSLTEKVALADVVLSNAGSLENLQDQIEQAWGQNFKNR